MNRTNPVGKIRRRLKGLWRDTTWRLGPGRSWINHQKGARILVYHGICMKDHLRFNTLFLKQATFEDQLRLYKGYFNIVSLDDFYFRRFDETKFTLCLTFDDGFANNYRYVLPLLEQYQVPATFFITGIRETGYDILWNDFLSLAKMYGPPKFNFRNDEFVKNRDGIYISSSTGRRLLDILRSEGFEDKAEMMQAIGSFKDKIEDDYWLQMTPGEIRILSTSKWVTIGSHSRYHNDLAKMPATGVREDLAGSKKYLESIIGQEITALAFPYGSYNRETITAAKDVGYTQLLATEFYFPGDRDDVTLRERLTINPFISNINQLHANINGNYE